MNVCRMLLFISLFAASYAYSFQFALSLEDSIVIAKEYIKKNNIDVGSHFLSKVKFKENCKKGMCWELVWRYRLSKTDGGDVIIFVYPDKSVESTYGE